MSLHIYRKIHFSVYVYTHTERHTHKHMYMFVYISHIFTQKVLYLFYIYTEKGKFLFLYIYTHTHTERHTHIYVCFCSFLDNHTIYKHWWWFLFSFLMCLSSLLNWLGNLVNFTHNIKLTVLTVFKCPAR